MDVSLNHDLARAAPAQHQGAIALRGTYPLLLAAGLGALLPLLLLIPFSWARIGLGLAAVLLMPGYALTEALLPDRGDADRVTLAALSVGLSVAILPILTLLLSVLPWGIRPVPMVSALSLWIVTFCTVAVYRRATTVLAGPPWKPSSGAPFEWWAALGRSHSRRFVLVALASAAILAWLVAHITAPSTQPTEFFMLGKHGQVQDYPRDAAIGSSLSITIGITHREPGEQTYLIEGWVVDRWPAERRALVVREGPLTLSSGDEVIRNLTWRMSSAGDDQEVEFLLFRSDDPKPYRRLQLWLDVSP
jgi:uncharacterized membrane protein